MGTASWKVALVAHQHGFGQRALHRRRLQMPACGRPAGNPIGACRIARPFLHPMGYGQWGRILAPFQSCSCVKRQPAACQLPLTQNCPKVSSVPHFCSESENIPWKIGCTKVIPLPKSTIYLLLIPHFFFFFFLAEDPLSNTFFKRHF